MDRGGGRTLARSRPLGLRQDDLAASRRRAAAARSRRGERGGAGAVRPFRRRARPLPRAPCRHRVPASAPDRGADGAPEPRPCAHARRSRPGAGAYRPAAGGARPRRARANARAHALSRGEAQRAALARALVNGPEVVLADEPTSSLDDDNAARAAALLREQAEANDAVLVVASHDRRIADSFARRLDLARRAA